MKIRVRTTSSTHGREFTLKVGEKIPYDLKWLYEMGGTIAGITIIHDTEEVNSTKEKRVYNFEKKK